MDKPEVYPFPGSTTDVIVTLTHLAEQLNTGGTNDGEGPQKSTEFHLWSTVLKEQSKYFKAHILRWSKITPSESVSVQPGSATPRRRMTLKCIDGVGPLSYAKCFQAMYEAHYGEPAHILAQIVVKSVGEALGLLRVAANLGFDVGVDASLLHIQAVPWTADEEASITECVNSLLVPVSDTLAARLGKGEESILFRRSMARDALLECWKERLHDWKSAHNAILSSNLEPERKIRHACNAMFGLFGKAVDLGVGDELIQCLVEDEDMRNLWIKSGQIICCEAVLLVFLRVMQALSKGEVVCSEAVRLHLLSRCLEAFNTVYSSPGAQRHFRPGTDSEALHMSAQHCPYARDLDTYLKAYSKRKSDIKQDLVASMALVIKSLQPKLRRIPLAQWLSGATSYSTSCAEDDWENVLTKFMTIVDANLP